MATIDDKINLFATIVIDKAEKQVKDNMNRAYQLIDEQFLEEKERIVQQAVQIMEERARKAELRKVQILSKARMNARQKLLLKKEQLVNQTIDNLKKRAVEFVHTPDYENFLRSSIKQALSGMNEERHLIFFFIDEDLSARENLIRETIMQNLQPNAVYTLQRAERNIIGGCICSNEERTKRTDCSLAARLEESRELIGSIISESLQQVVSE